MALTTAGSAAAAVPAQVAVEGFLFNSSGSPAPDGTYTVTFRVYETATAATALWTEANAVLGVKNGQFSWALGSKVPIDAAAAAKAAWFGLTIDKDPELPRKPIQSTFFALHAGMAHALECTGCVAATALDSKVWNGLAKSTDLSAVGKSGQYKDLLGAPDLGSYAKTADLSTYAKASDLSSYAKAVDLTDYVKASSLAKVAGTGQYSDLAGLPVLPKLGTSCGTGLVVKGLKADGSLECVAGGDQNLSNAFTNKLNNVYTNEVPIAIPNAKPQGTSLSVVVPDIGLVEGVSAEVDVANSDISKLKLTLLDPTGTSHLLYNGGMTGTALKTTFPSPTPMAAGNLDAWIGKSPKGDWHLMATDLSPSGSGDDGFINRFSIKFKYAASGKLAAVPQLTDVDGHVYGRIGSVVKDGVGDGQSVSFQATSQNVVAQGWLWDTKGKAWIAANTGASGVSGCTACGTGKDGDYAPTSSTNLSGGTYEFKSFTVKSGVTVTVTGSSPLIIKVAGDATIDGTIQLSGGNAPAVTSCCPDSPGGTAGGGGGAAGATGPGGGGTANGSGSGGGSGGCASSYGAGGGGAGHATNGSNGGTSGNSCGSGGSGGSAYGSTGLSNGLEPGSGGGSGGYGGAANSAGGGGGGGGGAIQIIANKITIGSQGGIFANGGAGGNITNDRDGGAGGGGSGGSIWLRGTLISVNGKLEAIGGKAGVSDKVNGYGGDGGAGAAGRIRVDAVAPYTGPANPSAFVNGAVDGLDAIGNNKFFLQVEPLGLVTLKNQSGLAQKVMLVVTY